MSDSIYYKLLQDDDGKYKPVAMQWFDESDYDQKKLLPIKFATEDQAWTAATLANSGSAPAFIHYALSVMTG